MYNNNPQGDGVSMASTLQGKSQPLHNFDLPHLTWNSSKDGDRDGAPPHHHRQRRSSVSSPSRRPSDSPSHVRPSSVRDGPSSASLSPLRSSLATVKGGAIGCSRNQSKIVKKDRPRGGLYSDSEVMGDGAKDGIHRQLAKSSAIEVENSRGTVEKLRNLTIDCAKDRVCRQSGSGGLAIESKLKGTCNPDVAGVRRSKVEVDADVVGTKNSKILIKLPCKKANVDDQAGVEVKHKEEEDDDSRNNGNSTIADEETKTWNLRPRKPIHKSLNAQNMVQLKNNGNNNYSNVRAAESPLGIPVENEGNGVEKKDKRKLSINIALTKDEIEEDIFAMTGSKPVRRPKKRAKNVQKQLDYTFPGLWLVGLNADSYKVSENSMKG